MLIQSESIPKTPLPIKSLSDQLWYELELNGFTFDFNRYDQHLMQLLRMGECQKDRLVELCGRERWIEMVAAIGPARQEEDLVRVLGFGNALTSFTCAPFSHHLQVQLIKDLGALCNLIVSLYDYFLDHAAPRTFTFPEQVLHEALRGNYSSLQRTAAQGIPAQRIIAGLVLDYFQLLGSVPADANADRIKKILYKTIWLMFEAENAAAADPAEVNDFYLKRKSALPFVVIGLPGLLLHGQAALSRYPAYLRWLYDLGEFIGWVDDVVDIRRDLQNRQPNRLLFFSTEAWPGQLKKIALMAGGLPARLEEFMTHEKQNYPAEKAMFIACIVFWLGVRKRSDIILPGTSNL